MSSGVSERPSKQMSAQSAWAKTSSVEQSNEWAERASERMSAAGSAGEASSAEQSYECEAIKRVSSVSERMAQFSTRQFHRHSIHHALMWIEKTHFCEGTLREEPLMWRTTDVKKHWREEPLAWGNTDVKTHWREDALTWRRIDVKKCQLHLE